MSADPNHLALEGRLEGIVVEVSHVRAEMRDARTEMRELRRTVDQMPMVVQQAIRQQLDDFVTADAFAPVRALVYGLVGLVGAAVIGALMALVLGGRV